MTAVGAVGIELWSMSDSLYFDNVLITDLVRRTRVFPVFFAEYLLN